MLTSTCCTANFREGGDGNVLTIKNSGTEEVLLELMPSRDTAEATEICFTGCGSCFEGQVRSRTLC